MRNETKRSSDMATDICGWLVDNKSKMEPKKRPSSPSKQFKICRHCQHWTIALREQAGVCQKITQLSKTSNNKAVVQVPGHDEHAYLLTAPDFGCTLFEPVKERKRK